MSNLGPAGQHLVNAGLASATAGVTAVNPFIGGALALGQVGYNLWNKWKTKAEQDRLNRIQQEREDTAYQRAVVDAHLAGLSKASISGPSPSTALTAPQAPEADFVERSQVAMMNRLSMMQQVADYSKTMEESRNIQFQNMRADAESKFYGQNALNNAELLVSKLGISQYEQNTLLKDLHDLRFAQKTGIDYDNILKRVQSRFEQIRESAILDNPTRKSKYVSMLASELQSQLDAFDASSMHSKSQYSHDLSEKIFYDFMNQPENHVLNRFIKTRTGDRVLDPLWAGSIGIGSLFN